METKKTGLSPTLLGEIQLQIPPPPDFAAVIFDMDGLLLDSEPVYRHAWQQAASELGYRIADTLYVKFLGGDRARCEILLKSAFGPDFPFADFIGRKECYFHDFVSGDRIPLRPGAEALLAALETRGIPKAIATSSTRADALLSLRDLAGRFEAIVTSEQVRAGKPAPDIFLLATQQLAVEPARCLVLEDSEAGIQGAAAAGMLPVFVPDLRAPSATVRSLALGIYSSLHEVKTWLCPALDL